MSPARRWLFADQLGPHFLDGDDDRVVLVESTEVLRRRRFHRRKAHLVLSALRHRAAELGERAVLVAAPTYAEGLAEAGVRRGEPVRVSAPTSYAARRLVDRLAARGLVEVGPARGFAVTQEEFETWAGSRGGRRLLLDDFYREVRLHHRLLLDDRGGPLGGRWSHDHENREPPPKKVRRLADSRAAAGLPDPWWPEEDEIDAQVREDLDRRVRDEGLELVGEDGPRRFPVTRAEATTALRHFLDTRLPAFGPWEDAMLAGDPWMAHSLISAPMNLGLLHPVEVARAAERAHVDGGVPVASVEGFVRQVVGWRDYVWHVYWHAGEDYRDRNALDAREPLPRWFADLDAGTEVGAACLADVLGQVRREGWVHHIPRLMVLGNWALQRGWSPQELTAWFHDSFVDGYDWVMVANVVGMSQHADGGVLATKPYAAGGAYISRMSDYCGGCRYDPKVRVGERACPFTAGYWAFLDRVADRVGDNPRMRQPLAGLRRLADRDAVVEQERHRGPAPP